MDQQRQAEAYPNKSLFRRRRYLVPAGAVLLVIALLGGFAPRLSKSKVAAADTQQLAGLGSVGRSGHLSGHEYGHRVPGLWYSYPVHRRWH